MGTPSTYSIARNGMPSAVDQASDVGMIEAGQHLSLQAEAAQDFGGVHAALHQLHGHLLRLAASISARRQPHRAHAPAADALFQPVGAGAEAFRIFARFLAGIGQRVAQIRRGVGEKAAGLLVAGEQALYFAAQFVVAGAHHAEIRGAIPGSALQRAVKRLPDLRPSLRRHSCLPSSGDAETPARNSNCASPWPEKRPSLRLSPPPSGRRKTAARPTAPAPDPVRQAGAGRRRARSYPAAFARRW